jgi:hypothetical protein
MLIRVDYSITAFPIFTDRGNILAMLRARKLELGLELSRKFCEEHLVRNIISKFNITSMAAIKAFILARITKPVKEYGRGEKTSRRICSE